MVRELKFRLVEDGQCLDEHITLVDSLNKEGNSMGSPRSKRGDWADDLDLRRLPSEKADVLFHAGCRSSFDKEQQKSIRAAVMLLKNAGVNIGIMGEQEMCCAGRIYSMGYRDEFTRFAKANITAWAKAGVKTVVTSCSDGYHAFKRLYPRLGSRSSVSTVEYLDRLIKGGKLKFRHEIPMTITYHDPCHLGRQGEQYIPWDGVEKKIKGQIIVYEPNKPRYNGAWGIYDPPRNVLKSIPGVELVEMERIREYSWCCGPGEASVRLIQSSQWTARENCRGPSYRS
jgi:Fe-S oxidoreductase